MSLTVRLSEELTRRVSEVAAQRRVSPEQVALEAIEAQLPIRRRLSFSAIGSSGSAGGDIALRHREVIAEDLSEKAARNL